MEPGSSSVADYDIHSSAPGQFSPKDSNSSGEVKSSGNSFPLPTINCYREISRGSSPGNGTSSRERPQDVLRGRTVLYCLAVYSANSSKLGLGGQKEKSLISCW